MEKEMNNDSITIKEIGNYGRNKVQGFPDPYYKPMIGAKEINVIAETEDIAYLLALNHKYLGPNDRFTKYACRILNIKSVWRE